MKIIYFMHIPFPTSQIFRTVPMSTTFLQSMVCADLVGFHAFDHARHFLNATKRLLGIKSYTRTGGMLTLLVRACVSHVYVCVCAFVYAVIEYDFIFLGLVLRRCKTER